MNKTTEAFEAWWADIGEQSLFALNTTTDDDIKILAGIAWEAAIREALAEHDNQEPVAVVEITYGRDPECYVTGNIDNFPEGVFKLYAAPVRTKDLTDDEIDRIAAESTGLLYLDFARAVIAADREKNK